MKEAFLVIGPESSGNHLTCELLKRMGCYWQDEGSIESICSRGEDKIVIRRSVPHGYSWPNCFDIKREVALYDYRVTTIVPVREWWATVLSNLHRRYSDIREAAGVLIKAQAHIAKQLQDMEPYFHFNVSAFFKDHLVVRSLELFTGLSYRGSLDWAYDADKPKHVLINDCANVYSITKQMIEEANGYKYKEK